MKMTTEVVDKSVD